MPARQEGQPRPTIVNKFELQKKPFKKLLARAGNSLVDMFLVTILGGAIIADRTNHEAISMSSPKRTPKIK